MSSVFKFHAFHKKKGLTVIMQSLPILKNIGNEFKSIYNNAEITSSLNASNLKCLYKLLRRQQKTNTDSRLGV